MTEFQAQEQLRRERAVLRLIELTSRNKLSQNQAARVLGESAATLSRWRRAFEASGRDGLIPSQAEKCGGKPKFELNAEEQNALRHCRLRKDSLPLAIEDFIGEPECRPETRAKILEELDAAARDRRLPNWPLSLRRAGHVSEDEKALFRGKKHAQQYELVERRGLWWIDESGAELPITGNALFESDDMSVNKPFRFLDPHSGRLEVGRQSLCSINVASSFFLAASPVGRERDAYRLEDIADHLRGVVEAHGLPLIWRFEKGAWENQIIDGVKIQHPDGTSRSWGGLDHLFKVVHGFKSRAKGLIETSFDHLQALMDHDPASEGLCIGRKRGEFERATKLFLAAGRGDTVAASHFWEIAEAADGIAAAMHRFNHRPKVRRAFGRAPVVPADLQRDAVIRECPANELWRFSPIKREATVRGGAIEVSIPHYPFPFRFRVNGSEADSRNIYLEHGYAVLIAFHPGHPEEGCHVFNAERGARNRDGLKFGELILVASFAEDAPQVNLHPSEFAYHARKNANAAVRSEFRAIVGAGRQGRRISTARDGYGNSATRSDSGEHTRPRVSADAPSRREPFGDVSARAPKPAREARAVPFDEEEELARIARLEKDAVDRGDILIT